MDSGWTVLYQYGVAGVAMVAQAVVIIRLYNDKQKLQDKYDKDTSNLQEGRRTDAIETANKVTNTMSGIAQTFSLFSEKIERAKGKR